MEGLLLLVALILILLVLVAALSRRFNVPLIILALAVGLAFGSDVTGLIYFDDAALTQRVANIALVFVLFAGGYGTKTRALKPVARPALLLAVAGVLVTGGVTAVLFSVVAGWPLMKSLMLAAVISSTDAAAVFSILRSRSFKGHAAPIAEIESAANDPAAIIATTIVIQAIVGAGVNPLLFGLRFVWQLAGGVAVGVIVGFLGDILYEKIKNVETGYFYLLLVGLILLSFGLADALGASGMLAAFFAGYVLGNRELPLKKGITAFTETLAFIANVGLFVLLGLLAFPSRFPAVWLPGVLVFLILTFVARPVAVLACTPFSRLSVKEKLFLSWSGLRGAVPIVLATYPAAAGLDPEHEIFNIVFFTVTLSLVFQGSTLRRLADFLKLTLKARRPSRQTMELVTVHRTEYDLVEIHVDEEEYTGSCRVSDLSLPAGTTITMINRRDRIIAPAGATVLKPGDVISVLVDRSKVEETTMAVLGAFRRKRKK